MNDDELQPNNRSYVPTAEANAALSRDCLTATDITPAAWAMMRAKTITSYEESNPETVFRAMPWCRALNTRHGYLPHNVMSW